MTAKAEAACSFVDVLGEREGEERELGKWVVTVFARGIMAVVLG